MRTIAFVLIIVRMQEWWRLYDGSFVHILVVIAIMIMPVEVIQGRELL